MLIALCALLVSPACLRRRALVQNPHQAKKANRSTSPATLSEFIRSVLKISQENTQAADEAAKRLLDQKPELADLSRRVAEDAKDLDARRALAAAYMEEGLYSNAFQVYQGIRTLAPDDPGVELAIARIWDRWGDYALARQYAERALVLDSRLAGGLDLLGRIHLHRKDPDAALSAFLTALRYDPENASVLANTGYAFLTRGDWAPARRYLERAVERDASLAEARNNLGIALAHLGDRDGALRQFAAVSRPAVAFNNLGVVNLAQGRFDLARDAFRQALVLDPDYPIARANLSEAGAHLPPPTVVNLAPLGPLGPLGENRKSVQPAAGSDSTREARFSADYGKALNLFRQRRYEDAIGVLDALLRDFPDHRFATHCRYWIGENYFGLRDYEKALAAFKRVLQNGNSMKEGSARLMIARAQARIAQKTKSTVSLKS